MGAVNLIPHPRRRRGGFYVLLQHLRLLLLRATAPPGAAWGGWGAAAAWLARARSEQGTCAGCNVLLGRVLKPGLFMVVPTPGLNNTQQLSAVSLTPSAITPVLVTLINIQSIGGKD